MPRRASRGAQRPPSAGVEGRSSRAETPAPRYLIEDYFETFLPEAVLKILIPVMKQAADYKGFGDFSGEMKGYAEALDLDLGYVVTANLVYQLEHIGLNCSASVAA